MKLLKRLALRTLEAVQANKERTVALLTVFVFAPAGAWLSGWAARQGISISPDEVVKLEVGSYLGVIGLAGTWLVGAMKERSNASAERVAAIQAPSAAGKLKDARDAAAGKVAADNAPEAG